MPWNDNQGGGGGGPWGGPGGSDGDGKSPWGKPGGNDGQGPDLEDSLRKMQERFSRRGGGSGLVPVWGATGGVLGRC